MDEVVNADKVSVVRPIDLPSGTYSPDAVVTIDSGNRNEPLKKLPLGELMPKTDVVSVLKGNCNDNSITPEPEGDTPEDWDCYEVEKDGEDIWIGDDQRIHAKAGWYHVDMGVFIGSGKEEADARASILFGAYTGTVPDGDFNYSDYCGVDFDLSYDHMETHSAGFDIHVDNDGDILHLSASAPDDLTAECYLDWFSIHRIADVVAGGGGGGDTPSGDCNVHVIDLQLVEGEGVSLWEECIGAVLDGKLVAIRMGGSTGEDNFGAVCWSGESMVIPTGYTKASYIEYLRNSMYSSLTFYGTHTIAGTLLYEHIQFTVDPWVGLQLKWMSVTSVGVGIVLVGDNVSGEFGSLDVICFDYSDPDNPITTLEPNALIDALGAAQNSGIPLFLVCRNSTREFSIYGPAYLTSYGMISLKVHDIATYYEDPDDTMRSEQIPVDYFVRLQWHDDPDRTTTQGYYTIYNDAVYPLALDSRFGGPVL